MAVSAGVEARPTAACVNTGSDVPLALATLDQQTKILTTIDAIEPNTSGATPNHDAYGLAIEQLRNTALTGTRYLALITDGQPTQSLGCIGTGSICSPQPTPPIVQTIQTAQKDDGIRTFVVGSLGSERKSCTAADVRGWLSEAARAGRHGQCRL